MVGSIVPIGVSTQTGPAGFDASALRAFTISGLALNAQKMDRLEALFQRFGSDTQAKASLTFANGQSITLDPKQVAAFVNPNLPSAKLLFEVIQSDAQGTVVKLLPTVLPLTLLNDDGTPNPKDRPGFANFSNASRLLSSLLSPTSVPLSPSPASTPTSTPQGIQTQIAAALSNGPDPSAPLRSTDLAASLTRTAFDPSSGAVPLKIELPAGTPLPSVPKLITNADITSFAAALTPLLAKALPEAGLGYENQLARWVDAGAPTSGNHKEAIEAFSQFRLSANEGTGHQAFIQRQAQAHESGLLALQLGLFTSAKVEQMIPSPTAPSDWDLPDEKSKSSPLGILHLKISLPTLGDVWIWAHQFGGATFVLLRAKEPQTKVLITQMQNSFGELLGQMKIQVQIQSGVQGEP